MDAASSAPGAEGSPPGTWEAMAIDAVGSVIEFWGFKRNQGRVWALLYLRGEALPAAAIEQALTLSKGAVSMLLRDLEHWGVVSRVPREGAGPNRYLASTDVVRMVARVIAEREAGFVADIRRQLEAALSLAAKDRGVPEAQRTRLEKMAALAEQVDRGLQLFVQTARLDVGTWIGILREGRGPSRSSS